MYMDTEVWNSYSDCKSQFDKKFFKDINSKKGLIHFLHINSTDLDSCYGPHGSGSDQQVDPTLG